MHKLRFLAARIINAVTDGQSLTDLLERELANLPDPRDRAWLQATTYGTCRLYSRLDVLLSFLLKKPMQAKDGDVHALLMVGLYQLIAMRTPEHAAVAETVQAANHLKKPWAKALVNAVLRNFLRNRDALVKKVDDDPEGYFAHPSWWINEIKKVWPNNWEMILSANNSHPPFALRVNIQMLSRVAYQQKVPQAHIIPETKSGLILDQPLPIDRLPGFTAGEVSVQDGAAQLAALLLKLEPAQHVLDACAAPGGKLTHILELEPHLASCTAVEKDHNRLTSIKENLARLHLKANLHCADVVFPKTWWDGQIYERILVDAPCSASGVIRRHPDIKLLRQPQDIRALAKIQLEILNALWPLLAPKGLLLYVTCSIFPDENNKVIATFLAQHPDAAEDKLMVDWGLACAYGRQILPGMHEMDGFYYARLLKK